MGKGSGFGKAILFGEHFVVYSLPGIVGAIGAKTTATATKGGKGIAVEDNRPETPGYKEKKIAQMDESVKRVLTAMGIDVGSANIKIALGGDLIAMSGIGASAASCVAIARAVSEEFGLGFDDKRINEVAYEGEKAYHGSPSGIDNTASTFGGLTWFVKGTPSTFEPVAVKSPVEIVMGNTGIASDTAEVVAAVKERKEKEPAKYAQIFGEYEAIAKEARSAVGAGDNKKLGALMDKNHELCKQIGISHDKIEELVGIAKRNGALGAKVTGTGCGGSMIALTPEKALQEKVAKAMEKAGYSAIRTTIGAHLSAD